MTVADNHLSTYLEAENLILELADRAGFGVAKRLGGFLHGADHGGRSAEQDFDVRSGRGQALLYSNVKRLNSHRHESIICPGTYHDHLWGNETDAASPVLGRVVQDIVDIKGIILPGETL